MDKALMNPAELLKQQLAETNERINTGDSIRIRMDGKMFTTPDGLTGKELNVVVLDYAMVNAYYDRAYVANDPKPPACFAVAQKKADMAPVATSPVPQHEECKTCPHNQWQSAGSGSKGKACKNMRLLAVVPIVNIAEADIWLLSVPPSSTNKYDEYVRDLATEANLAPLFVHTIIGQDKKITYAAPRFEHGHALNKDDLSAAISRLEEARKLVLEVPDMSAYVAP
jgi:hypothetical protein